VLIDLTSSARRLALVGLAKNTGKTETLAALLRELQAAGRTIAVTSVGRDGEEHDVIDARISKPRVNLLAGSFVASTDELLRASGVPYELVEQTDVRTPLGRVLIVRLSAAGAVEVAGPSAAEQVRAVSDSMLVHGAQQVLIDGAVDRRAASSPEVSDGLVMATGAVLSKDIGEVVAQTREAVELARLPAEEDDSPGARRALAWASAAGEQAGRRTALIGAEGQPVELAPRFVLRADAAQIAQALDAAPAACMLVVEGALPERFLEELVAVLRRRRRELTVLVGDATRVFLSAHGVSWYRSQGLTLRALRPTSVLALTVNPLAPQSHRFDSAELRALLEDSIDGVPIFDVCHPDYREAREPLRS
jgi:hypothetical protein